MEAVDEVNVGLPLGPMGASGPAAAGAASAPNAAGPPPSPPTPGLVGKTVLVWFRRDLRVADNPALLAAAAAGAHVVGFFDTMEERDERMHRGASPAFRPPPPPPLDT